MMASAGLLSLKWNNHKTTFFHVLSTIRSKEAYCDVTIACDGRFYPVHKLVMSTCSDYFKEMFERTNCKHPVIVLKDIRHEDIEALLNYMYVGEVNVLQNELAGLIKAAECLMIKGLAVPDESPTKESPKDNKRGETKEGSPQAKRRRYDDSDSSRYDNNSNISGRALSQNSSQRESSSSSSQPKQSTRHSSSASDQSPSSRRQPASSNHTSENLPDDHRSNQVSRISNNFQTSPENSRSQDKQSNVSQRTETLVVLDEPSQVKEEPEEIQEVEEVLEDTKNVLESSFSYEHLSEGDSMSNIGDGGNQDAQGFDGQVISGAPQSMEDLVAQAIPGSSGMEMGSLWESEGSLQGLPPEAFGDAQGHPQMVRQRVLMCPFCSRSNFKWASDLQRHIRIHTGEKPFHCHICKYSATQKNSLEYHLRTHTGEKPFHCHICNYSASRKSSLEYHLRTHTGEKPYACSQCPYRSAHKGGLDNHLLNNHVNKE